MKNMYIQLLFYVESSDLIFEVSQAPLSPVLSFYCLQLYSTSAFQ